MGQLWVLMMIGALLTGCGGRTEPPVKSGEFSYLALGDSYTIGENVSEAERWPVQLAAALREQGVSIAADPEIIARTGWTTTHLTNELDRKMPSGPYGLVSLLIGVNNQYQGQAAEAYRAEFKTLLQRAIKLAGGQTGRVIVLSIPDWGATPFGARRNPSQISLEIDQFNAINREETLRAGAYYVDITPQSRTAATDPAMVAGDGLHPSGKMYAEWVKLVVPVVLTSLAPDNP